MTYFQNKSWLLYACLLSFNSGKLRPFIWDFEDVFRLRHKLSACFKAHVQFVDLYYLVNCWESLSAVLTWMHTEVQVMPLIFYFARTKGFCCKQNLSSHFSTPFFPLFSPLCQTWSLFLFEVLVSKNTGVSRWPLQLQWRYPFIR